MKRYLCVIVAVMVIFCGISGVNARDLDPNYKFSGIKPPESPYKNTWSAFETDLFSGSFGYEFKIEVPPGTNGLAPKITISYNSHSAKGKPGWLGAGWDIPLSYIQRDIEYTRKDTSDDTFDLFLNGAKHDLVFVSSDNRFHTKIESFLKIEKLSGGMNEKGEYWLVTSKDGTKYRFGYMPDSEHIVATTDNSMQKYVWRWSLDQITDTNGNNIYFSYTENPENGETYLSKIEYNNERRRQIEFVLGERMDERYPGEYVGNYLFVEQGSEIIETKRLNEIKVTVDGQLSKRYVMNYARNEAENKLLLTSITTYGSDGVSALPPVRFEYKPLVQDFEKTEWHTPGDGKYLRKTEEDGDMYYDVLDMNGDGLPDYVKYDTDDKEWEVWMNTKKGFSSEKKKWKTGSGIRYIQDVREEKGKATNTRSTMMDFNRDGYTDLVRADGGKEFKYVLNNGTEFLGSQSFSMPISAWIRDTVKVSYDKKGNPKNAPNVEQALFDINGDGLPDIVKRAKINSDDNNAWAIYRNTGNGFVYYETWRVYHSQGHAWIEDVEKDDSDVEVTTRDMNGDGLVDIIWGRSESDWRVYYNTGSHFRESASWAPPGLNDDDIIEIHDYDDKDKANDTDRDLIDINGDGLPDIVHAKDDNNKHWKVYLNRGDRFLQRRDWHTGLNTEHVRDMTYDDKKSCVKRDMLDINGDGLPDIVSRTSDSHWDVYVNQSKYSDYLVKITDIIGGVVSVSYTDSVKYDNTRLPFNYWLVESVITDNGMTNAHRNVSKRTFEYSKGFYDFPSREFRGFGQVNETRADGTKTIHYFFQDEARKGKEFRTEIRSISDALFAKTENAWAETSPAANILFPRLDSTDDYTYDGVAENPRQIRTEFKDYDSYGNAKQEVRFGDVVTSADDFTEYREFDYKPERWIMDRIAHSYILDAGGGKLRESWSEYYDNGNLKNQKAWLNGGVNPITRYEYDEYGNRTKIIDPKENFSRTEFDDDFHTFPVRTWNALNQKTEREFNKLNGQVLRQTDPNNISVFFEYDFFGRKIKEIKPGDSSGSPTVEIRYFIDGTAPEFVLTLKKDSTGTLDIYQMIDGFANLIQTRTEAESAGFQIVTDVFYDTMGRVKQQSNPYSAGMIAGYGEPVTTIPSISYLYDTLGRPVKVFNPDGTSISRTFDHWKVTETDENIHPTMYWFDAYQSLVQVQEINGFETYTTRYEYNPAGELKQITDHLNNVTQIQYDTLGRKVYMKDPDMGEWRYGYDSAGNLIEQTDAKTITTTIGYDKLYRKTLIDYPNDADVRFYYDEDKTRIGTLSRIEDAAGTVSYQYDNRLRKEKETRTIDGKTWEIGWKYDTLDRVIEQAYPDGQTVTYVYNSQGALESIPGIVSNLDYNQSGQITQKKYGNGLTTAYSYYPANQRLLSMNSSVQNLEYAYDKVGNVSGIKDGIAGKTEKFGYDDLDRLTSAGDGAYTAAYIYDAVGNMLAETMNGMNYKYSYGKNAGPHALTEKATDIPVVGSFVVNNNAPYATVQNVTLNHIAFGNPTHYMASEHANFSGATWQTYSATPVFALSSGFGWKTVYFKVKNDKGESEVRNDTLEYLFDNDGDGIPDKYDDDDDNDGIPDTWEVKHGLNPLSAADGNQDNDGDSVNNLEEYKYGGNPHSADSDGDGWNDYDEIFVRQTNPANADTDGDGIKDSVDLTPGTFVQHASGKQYSMISGSFSGGGDNRSNGTSYAIQDRVSKLSGLLSVSQITPSVIERIDSRGGIVSLPDWVTIVFPPGATNEPLYISIVRLNVVPPPNDGFQLAGYVYDITATNDKGEIVTSFSIPVQITIKYDPLALGVLDEDDLRVNYYNETDQKWEGMTSSVNLQDFSVTTSTTHFTKFGLFGTLPNDDSDGDGLPDEWETDYFDDLSHDGKADSDNDGLTDAEEYTAGTNPTLWDTDGDGIPDDWEVRHGLYPLWQDAEEDQDGDGKSNLNEYLSENPFEAGVFIVGDSGIIGVDWLYDGGKFVGELGIFSLTGMENFIPGSPEFVKEAARRALSASELGYVVISDQNEGARFRGTLPGESADWNSGNYKGLKKFAMKPGDTFATILVPNSTMQAIYDDPSTSDTQKRPLFSLVASNADYGMHIGQLADVNGEGIAFVYEDLDFGRTDKDYNDFIFQIGGVGGNIPMLESLLDGDLPLLDTVVADGKNWTEAGTGLAEKIMAHIESPIITPDTQWMSVTLSGSAELRVTDPQQQTIDKTGADIPGAIIEYGANGEQTVYLTDPDTGKYSFVLTSTTAGVSTFTVRNYKGEEETRSDSKQIQMLLGEVFRSDSAVSMNGNDLVFTFGSPESVSAVISADAGLYGKIKPSGYVAVNPGQSQVFIITPEPACHITDVLVDGVSVGTKSEYIFDYVQGKHTIRAVFDRDVYPIITATAGEGGKIEPSGEIVVKDVVKGQAFTITPSVNYHISDVLADGKSLGKISTYTFADVTENHTIQAVFELVAQTLKGDLNDNGTVDLGDVILCLKILNGIDTGDRDIPLSADVNGDGKIGIEELVYILQKVSGLR